MPKTPKTTTKRKPKTPKTAAATPACRMNGAFLRQLESRILGEPGYTAPSPAVQAGHEATVRDLTQDASLLGERLRRCQQSRLAGQRMGSADTAMLGSVLRWFADGVDPAGSMDATTLRGMLEAAGVAWLHGFFMRAAVDKSQSFQQTKSAATARRGVNAERDARIRERFEAERSKGRKATAAHLTLAREFRVSIDTVRRACRRPPG